MSFRMLTSDTEYMNWLDEGSQQGLYVEMHMFLGTYHSQCYAYYKTFGF